MQNTRKRNPRKPRAPKRRAELRTVGVTPLARSNILSSLRQRTGPEYKQYFTAAGNVQLYHNGSNGVVAGAYVPVIRPFDNMAQGVGDSQRIGNQIRAHRVTVRLWLSNKSDRSNVIYRIIAGITPAGGAPGTAGGFYSGSGSGNALIDFDQNDNVGLIYDKVLNPVQGVNTVYPSVNVLKEHSYYHEFDIPWKNNVGYTNASALTNNFTLCVFPIAYDAFGSLAADNIASYSYATRVIYTDI